MAVIFAIDQIVEREILSEQDALQQEMKRLHAALWEVFSSVKGEKLKALLSERLGMSSLRSMTDHDPHSGDSSYKTSFSTFNRSVEEMQSISVIPSGCLRQEVLARMTCEDASVISSSAGIANEEVQKSEELRRRDGLRRLLEVWREEGDEDEQRETLEYLKQALDEDRLSDRKLFS